MEAFKKPQHCKQVMGIATSLLICAHSKTSGFTCYSNDRTWLHRHGKVMSSATADISTTTVAKQNLIIHFINNIHYVHVSDARVEEPNWLLSCDGWLTLCSGLLHTVYVKLCRSKGPRDVTEMCVFPANKIWTDSPNNTLAIQWGKFYHFTT